MAAARIFLAASILSRGGQAQGQEFQVAKPTIVSGAPLGGAVGRDDVTSSAFRAWHQVDGSLYGSASIGESSEGSKHDLQAVTGVPDSNRFSVQALMSINGTERCP